MRNSSAHNTLSLVKLTLSGFTSSRRAAGAIASDRETHRAFGGKPADIAIECSLGDGIEAFIDEDSMEIKGPGMKR